MGSAPNILCLRCRELLNVKCHLVPLLLLTKETFLKIWNFLLKNNGNLIMQLNYFSQSLLHHLHYYPVNIRLDEDVFHLGLQKTSSRHLQDVLIKTNIIALVIHFRKTSSRRLGQNQHIRLGHASSRHFQDVLLKRLQDDFKTSLRCLAKTSSRHLQDILKISSRNFQDVFKTSSRHLQDVLRRCLQDVSSS